MTKLVTGWILCGALMLIGGSSPVLAGPQVIGDDIALDASPARRDRADAGLAVALDLSQPVEPISYQSLTPAFEPGDAYDPASDQHPMIPLPPGVWAGLITLSAVAYHTIRQQSRGARGRR